jgi:hypothetical protein
MSTEYPDILGDLVDARQRFEEDGVHYVVALRPSSVAPGEATALHAWLQSCWDVPVEAAISLRLPAHPPTTSTLSIAQARTDIPLEAAEVAEVTIPIASSSAALPGEYPISVIISAGYRARGLYIRSQRSAGQLGDTLLTFTNGLGLAETMGVGFIARTCSEQRLRLRIEGTPKPSAAPDLTPTFLSHWTVADLPIQGKAQQYVNDQRIYLSPKLARQPLYLAFMDESQARFRDAGLPLQIGEAIFLAKILSYTAEYFLGRSGHQDAILVPAYSLAFRYNLPVSDPIYLVARADYARMARLAASLSFGLLRQHLGQDPWTLEEQVAVANLIADRVERGGVLPAEFLYLPLLLGGLLVAGQIQMPGENLTHSLGLQSKARQQRTVDLSENQDLVALFDRLFTLAQAGQGS